MSIKRILLVGWGSIGKRHQKNLATLYPQARITILRSQGGSDATEGYQFVSTIEAALRANPEVAFICNPSSLHLGVATILARAGVHLFIEKPLSNSLGEITDLVEAVHETKVKVMVGYNLRFSPSLLELQKLIQNETYGKPLCVSAEVGQYLPDWRPDADYRTTVSAQKKLGGGALLELSHELDYLTWLFGNAIFASGQILKVSTLEIDVEDLVLAHICCNNNGRQLIGSIHLDFLQRRPHRTCKVVCEAATLEWNAINDSVEVHQKESSFVVFQGSKDRNYTYEQEVHKFMLSIETDTPEPISMEDGVRVMKLVEALKASSETGSVIYL